jgi:L-iditol 2-dehydrogenase
MKAIIVKEIGSFVIEDIELPELPDGHVLIKVEITGLCRTDLKLIRVGHHDLVMPRIPGEEVVGVICRTGRDAGEFSTGRRVYVYPGTSCGTCRYCNRGAGNLCEKMEIMGFHRHGGFAEYVIAPVASLIPVPDSLSSAEAVFAEPLSCCLNALELAGLKPGELIGIWGAGPAGTLLQRSAKAIKAHPSVIDPDRRRCDRIGAFTKPPEMMFDVCIVATGSAAAYDEVLSGLDKRGRLVIFSGLPPDETMINIDFNRFHYREQGIVGAYGCAYRHGELALEYLQKGLVEVKDLVSHRMSLWELDDALKIVERREGMKVLLYP